MVKVVSKQAVLLILLLHLMQEPCAGFYEKGSNVFLIKDQKQMQEQVEMFVRLRHSLPALIKVAANLKHMIYIGAVDTERSPVVAGSHFDDANPIQGVPTIKLFIPTGKKGRPKVVAYNGERKAKAIVAFLTQHMPNHVTVLRDSDASHDRFLNDKTKPKVVFVTDRTYTSTMFKALSSEYKGRVLIGEARKAEISVFQQYGAESLPALLQIVEDAEGKMLSLLAYDFSQKNARSFVKISNWIWDCERSWKKVPNKTRSIRSCQKIRAL